MSNTPRNAIVRQLGTMVVLAALLGMTVGCGKSSPAGPTPAPVTPVPGAISGYTVTAGTNLVAPGEPLSVSWTTVYGKHNDWIGFFKKGDPNTGRSWFTGWTDGETRGTFTFRAPMEAGQYEFRYLVDDSFTDAAVSSLVTVAK